MNKMNNYKEELSFKLKKITKIFDVDRIIKIKPSNALIANYYKINKLVYTIFHNRDFTHMGITRNGKFSNDDYLEQANLVDKYIKNIKARHVLELATGRGASCVYLARKHPNIEFEAIDLPEGQIDYALAKAKKLENFHPREGDYHDLSYYKPNSFDIVFIIEALCYSNNKQKVLSEVKRVLKKKGVFIVFDGYSGKPESLMTKEELLAKKLTEKSMLVSSFDYYPEFKRKLIKSGFIAIEEEDASVLVMPSLEKFETLAKIYFSLPFFFTELVNKIFPSAFINNAISGYLMPILTKLGVSKYMILVVAKNGRVS